MYLFFFNLHTALTCTFSKNHVTSKDRDTKDIQLRAIPEIVEPEADPQMDAENDVQHEDVQGFQYAVVQREPQAAASGRQVRVLIIVA